MDTTQSKLNRLLMCAVCVCCVVLRNWNSWRLVCIVSHLNNWFNLTDRAPVVNTTIGAHKRAERKMFRLFGPSKDGHTTQHIKLRSSGNVQCSCWFSGGVIFYVIIFPFPLWLIPQSAVTGGRVVLCTCVSVYCIWTWLRHCPLNCSHIKVQFTRCRSSNKLLLSSFFCSWSFHVCPTVAYCYVRVVCCSNQEIITTQKMTTDAPREERERESV